MSAGHSTEYVVHEFYCSPNPFPYSVLRCADGNKPALADRFRTCSGALYAARLLNDGLATINHHAVLGCRVEVK